MCQTSIAVIVEAQETLMRQHDITSETALNLLVWAATDSGVTVLEVAQTINEEDLRVVPARGDESKLYAIA